jgi:hypothetical protein
VSAARDFTAGRGAIPIPEVARFLSRSVAHVYRALGRGELRFMGAGRVHADSLIEFYEGGAANEVKQVTSRAVPVAAPHHREIKARAVTGGAISGGAS